MNKDLQITKLRTKLEEIYKEHNKSLLFHGWHHIAFVAKKAKEFAHAINADEFITESAALVHDLNYIVEINSEPEIGKDLRKELLEEAGYSFDEIERIEYLIMRGHTANRSSEEIDEVKALSDADTLFKALPITPILFASKYIQQNKVDVNKLSKKIVSEQKGLMESGVYFYTDIAREKYLHWAKSNLELWINVQDSLQDPDVQELLDIARTNEVL